MGHIYIRGKMDFDVTLYHAWVIQTQRRRDWRRVILSFYWVLGKVCEVFWKSQALSSLWVDRKNSHERLCTLYSKYERCLGSCQLVYGSCHFDRFWWWWYGARVLGVQRASARLDARLARAIFSSFWEAQSSIFFFEPRLELGSARVLKESSRVLEDLDLRTWDENESRVLL